MVDAMNGPQDRENRTPADPSMQAEKHHRHLRRTNEPINARSIWIRGVSLLLAKEQHSGPQRWLPQPRQRPRVAASWRQRRKEPALEYWILGGMPAPESFPSNHLAVIGCFAVFSQKMTVVKCPPYGIRMWVDDHREVRHSRRGF